MPRHRTYVERWTYDNGQDRVHECEDDHSQEVKCYQGPDLLFASDRYAHSNLRTTCSLKVDMKTGNCEFVIAKFHFGFCLIRKAVRDVNVHLMEGQMLADPLTVDSV